MPPKKPAIRAIVPCAKASESDLLADINGNPVWPIGRDNETEAMLTIAKVFAGSLKEISEPKIVAKNESSVREAEEVVLGIGEAADEAKLYAHLTQRGVQCVPNIETAQINTDVAVIVCIGPTLDPSLIEHIANMAYGAQAPGIIWGRTLHELRQRVLVASCAAALSTESTVPSESVVGARMGWLAEKPSSRSELLAALGRGAGLLLIYAHSDGIAQELPAGAAFCPRMDPDPRRDPRRAPECVYTGDCRLGVSVAAATESGRLISPSAIAARVVVDVACQAVFVGSQALTAEWASFPAMQANPRIGALVAPAHVFRLTSTIDQEFMSLLKEGTPIGVAIARYDHSETVETLHERLLLFGDPRVRTTAAVGTPQLIKRNPVRSPARRPHGSERSSVAGPSTSRSMEIDLFRLIAKIYRAETHKECEQSSAHLLELIRRAECTRDMSSTEAADHELRIAVLKHLALNRGRISDAMESAVSGYWRDQTEECPICGLKAPRFIVELRSGMARKVFLCISCANVYDYQICERRQPRVELPTVRLEGAQSDRGWDGALVFIRYKLKRTVSIPWPRRANGQPAQAVRINGGDGPGPVRMWAIFIDGSVINMMCQGFAGRSSDGTAKDGPPYVVDILD